MASHSCRPVCLSSCPSADALTATAVAATVAAAVAVAGVHRDARALFTDWRGGFYEHNKLANVYTAFELQRRYVLQSSQRYSKLNTAYMNSLFQGHAGSCQCRFVHSAGMQQKTD